MRVLIGVVVLSGGILIASGFKLHTESPTVDAVAGFVSGILSTTTGTNGPPLVLALHGRRLPPAVVRATLVVVYVFANFVSLLLFWRAGRINHRAVQLCAICFLPMLLGNLAGTRILRRVHDRHFHVIVLFLLFFGAATAIYTATR
jgi:uncharacterized protein